MKKSLQIGITGGIGAGKSLACRIFRVLGISTYDADNRAKVLMNTDSVLIGQIKKTLGENSYLEDGSVNRKYISELVFTSKESIAQLNALVHPRVALDYEAWANNQRSAPYILKEAALLFEAGTNKNLDAVIVVTAPEDLRISRVLRRDPHRSENDVRHIIGNQMREEEKIIRANFVLVNDETQLLIPQVLRVHEKLSSGNLS